MSQERTGWRCCLFAGKYFSGSSSNNVAYQWQYDGTSIANATNASLILTNVQLTNDGSYSVVVSNLIGVTVSSNAVLAVGYPPVITNQPLSQEIVQGTNVSFSVGVGGTGLFNYQWSFDGMALAQGTNSTLSLTNVQSVNGGTYAVVVSSPFGAITSSNASLSVELFPVIATQPQSAAVLVDSNVIFSVTISGAGPATLPPVSSGTLQLWLKADAGVVTNASGYVSQWADQSGNTNNAAQPVTNQQPLLVSAAGLFGKAAVRFNGIEDNVNGSYMHGTNLVNVHNAMNVFHGLRRLWAPSTENVSWAIGVPFSQGYLRGDMLSAGKLDFIFWSDDYVASYVLPANFLSHSNRPAGRQSGHFKCI